MKSIEYYYVDVEESQKLYDGLYRIEGNFLNRTLNYSDLTLENFNKMVESILNALENPIINKTDLEDELEEVDCINDDSKVLLEKLFSDPTLSIYGHGGRAKEVFESGKFKCRYANLDSHFLPLSYNNNSLSKLNNWPHNDAKEILILVLNNREYNPIYKVREKENEYDTEVNEIPLEYFLGYYDSELQKIVLNPNFKINHEYNPECSVFSDEELMYHGLCIEDNNIGDFYNGLNKILQVLNFSHKRLLSLEGLNNLKKYVLSEIKRLSDLQKLFTADYIKNVSENKEETIEETVDTDWDSDFDDWRDDFLDEEDKEHNSHI